MRFRRRVLTLIAMTSGVMLGCNGGPAMPSEEQARLLVAKHLFEYGALEDFRKTNGERQLRSEQPFYILHYRAAVSLPAGHKWYEHALGRSTGLEPQSPLNKTTSLPAGTTYAVEGTVTFRETENGWVASGGDITIRKHGYCMQEHGQDCYDSLWPAAE